ncbi:MAG: hypothetical protein H6641_19405 [Caldilineaceae bacterium]|nr:hypothetical protein [Caldilineaceae bacterium]
MVTPENDGKVIPFNQQGQTTNGSQTNTNVRGNVNFTTYYPPYDNRASIDNIPWPSKLFVGRDAILDSLIDNLTCENIVYKVVIEGMAGVGKTELACQAANSSQIRKFFKDGIAWIPFGKNANRDYILTIWENIFGLNNRSHSTEERKLDLRRQLADRRLLIIFDDVWSSELASEMHLATSQSRYILTTRDHSVAAIFSEKFDTKFLQRLDISSAQQLIRSVVSPEFIEREPNTIELVLSITGGLPIGIMLICGHLRANRLTKDLRRASISRIKNPIHRIEFELTNPIPPSHDRLMKKFIPKLFWEVCGYIRKVFSVDNGATEVNHQSTLKEVVLLSVESLHATARNGFFGLGAFAVDPEKFDAYAAAEVANIDSNILQELANRHLITEVGDELFTIHQLVADVARTGTSNEMFEQHWDYYSKRLHFNPETLHIHYKLREYGQLIHAWQNWFDTHRKDVVFPAESVYVYMELIGRFVDDHAQMFHIKRMLEQINETSSAVLLHAALSVHLGIVSSKLQEREDAVRAYENAERLLKGLGNSDSLSSEAHRLLGRINLGIGNWKAITYEDAVEKNNGPKFDYMLREAVELYRQGLHHVTNYADDPALEISLLSELIYTLALMGEWDQAYTHVQIAQNTMVQIEIAQVSLMARAHFEEVQGELYFMHGESLNGIEAEEKYQIARKTVRDEISMLLNSHLNESEYLIIAYLNMGKYLKTITEKYGFATSDDKDARWHWGQARDLAQITDMQEWENKANELLNSLPLY